MAQDLFLKQRAYFLKGITRGLDFRLENLRLLRDALHRQESVLLEALRKDLGKPVVESFASEIGTVLKEIDLALKQLRSWSRPHAAPSASPRFPRA